MVRKLELKSTEIASLNIGTTNILELIYNKLADIEKLDRTFYYISMNNVEREDKLYNDSIEFNVEYEVKILPQRKVDLEEVTERIQTGL